MTKEELLLSGLLEAYVLGECTKEEEVLVERFLSDDEVKAELDAIQEMMQTFGNMQAITPRTEVKQKIDAELFGETLSLERNNEQINAAKEISLPQANAQNNINYIWRAAAGFLLLCTLGTVWFFSQKLNSLDNTVSDLQVKNQGLSNNLQQVNYTSQQLKSIEEFFAHKYVKSIELCHPENSEQVFGMVYWCPTSGEVMINGMHLPDLSEDEQFQLWAVVGNDRLDLGVLPKDWQPGDRLANVMGVKNLNAFAITIEPLGGRPVPTLERLTAVAKI